MNTFKTFFLIKTHLLLLFITFLSLLLILSSCAKTRTITPITQSNRSKIKKIAILVEADEQFNVSVSREKNYSMGILSGVDAGMGAVFLIPLAIVWGLTEYEIRRHIDEKHEESLEAKLTQFPPGELMTEKLKNYLELSNADFTAEIPEVKSPSMLKAEGFDTILEVTLKEWEIKLCPKTSWSAPDLEPEEREALNKWYKYADYGKSARQFLYSEDAPHFKQEGASLSRQEKLEEMEKLKPLVQRILSDRVNVWFKLSGRMILIDGNSTVWKRKELYRDENCYPLVDLKTQPELLVDILSRAIHNLAENTVNEIL